MNNELTRAGEERREGKTQGEYYAQNNRGSLVTPLHPKS